MGRPRGKDPDEALVRRNLALHVMFDDAHYGTFGRSRGTAFLRLRELFDDARASGRTAELRPQLAAPAEASRLDLQAVADALAGKLPLVFHVDRASDILTA